MDARACTYITSWWEAPCGFMQDGVTTTVWSYWLVLLDLCETLALFCFSHSPDEKWISSLKL